MHHERQEWFLLAAASLAGGASQKQAVDNADKIIAAAKERFKDRDNDADD